MRSWASAALLCLGHVVTGSLVFAQVGSEQPHKVGGWEPCPRAQVGYWKKSKPRKRLVCSGVVGFPPQKQEWSGRPLHVGGSFQGQFQLMVGASPPHLTQKDLVLACSPGPPPGPVLKNYLQLETFICKYKQSKLNVPFENTGRNVIYFMKDSGLRQRESAT